MTAEQPTPNSTPEQPETGGALPADGRSAPAAQAPERGPSASATPPYREVTVRRAPKFVPFMVLGAVLGFLAALVIAYTGPADPTLTRESILGFFTVALALPGVLLAALIVLLVDRRSVRTAEHARAERTYDDEA